MKKSVPLLIVAIALVTGSFAVYSITKEEPYSNLQIASSSASFKHHANIDELEEEAELVVVAKYSGKREQYDGLDTQGRTEYTLTNSTVKIEKVLKGDSKKRGTIQVFEDCYIWNNERYVTTEGYKWMNEDGKYLLFLTPSALDNTYVIVGIYEGKFDLTQKDRAKEHKDLKKAFDDPEVEFLGEDFELEHFYKLKEEALKKYKL